jgi:hypothetical protein
VDDESAESNPFGLNTAELDVSPVKVSEPEADDVEAAATDYPPLNAYDIAQGPIDDESLTALIQRLRDDKQLLNDIIVEYRSETDPKRLSRLNTILGYVATPETLVLAQEMIYTDNQNSRTAGLDLLKRITHRNPAAFDIAADLISTETQPDILVAAMNIAARPKNASDSQRAMLESQVSQMVYHDSESVRRNSIAILSKISNDVSLDPIYIDALNDSDSKVREAAAFAYGEFPLENPQAIEILLRIAEDPAERKGLRRAAVYALKNKGLDDADRERAENALLDTRRGLANQ